MAAKWLRDESADGDSGKSSGEKRIKTIPSLPTILREVLAVKSAQNVAAILEPVLRKVVQEEVERGLGHVITSCQLRFPQKQIQAVDTPLKLLFSNDVAETIFTGSKIEDKENNPLRLLLVDTGGGGDGSLCSPIRVELVVLDGDFPGDRNDWTSEEFNRKIVRERKGKRPLLTGSDVVHTLRDGSSTISELTFTDNSSWIRNRQFRLGARVDPGSCEGLRIREAMTEPFMVKDHRGESYKKHYPPALHDEVWRLKAIGKDGAFHRKLQGEHINTVQDFLKLCVVDQDRLRSVLGQGLSDRMWEGTFGHAKTCAMGSKLYVYRRHQHVLLLNPICEVQGIVIDGHAYPPNSLNGLQRAYVRQLVLDAYNNWDELEEVDEAFGCAALQQQGLPQIAIASSSPSSIMYHPNDEENLALTCQNGGFHVEGLHGDVEVEFSGRITTPAAYGGFDS